MIDQLNKLPVDAEQIGLLHDIHDKPVAGHTCRGYTIVGEYITANIFDCPISQIHWILNESLNNSKSASRFCNSVT